MVSWKVFLGALGVETREPYFFIPFVMTMEVFSQILGKMAIRGVVWKNNTLICFADDVMIFSNVDMISIRLIEEALGTFKKWSRLEANPGKSNFFCFSISKEEKGDIL